MGSSITGADGASDSSSQSPAPTQGAAADPPAPAADPMDASDGAGMDGDAPAGDDEPAEDAAPQPSTPAVEVELPTTMESPGVAPWFNVYRPMDLDAIEGPLPIVVWANGGCYRSDFTWAPLFERWAAAGFVVLALTESPDGGALAQTSVGDHGALIDWALGQAEYTEKLDPERVVAAGNSCGGITALGLAADDARVAAVFVLSGSSSVFGADVSVMSAVTVPVGYVVGGSEDIAAANAAADYEALSDGVPAMIVSRSSGDHRTVSTDTMILPDVAEIALNWMDLTLHGTAAAAQALGSADVCGSCEPGVWSMMGKHLETLEQ
ncbi:MAG: hypothetical protein OXT09_16375 [Myxococcales bacterium]|nr:hypothetical protein [Myxococcales bacterium]